MAYTFQVVIDCKDPHVLAHWWAETLGWHVEPQDEEFIRSMIGQGHATEADTRVYNGDDVAAVRDALLARGATILYTGNQGSHNWVTMADPEGNEFCV